MANPQPDKYIKLSTELFEQLCKTRINGESRQMFDFIIRKTYGYHKTKDVISLSQFVLGTKLSKWAVTRARDKLLKMNLIGIHKNVDSQSITYWIIKDYEKWKLYTKKRLYTKKSSTIHILDNKLSTKTCNTIDSKDNTIDNMPTARDCLKYFGKTFEKKFGVGYVAAFGKEGKLFKDLLKNASFKEISAVIDAFFSSEDEFIIRSGHTVGVFISQFNKLRINPNNTTDSPALRELKRITGEE